MNAGRWRIIVSTYNRSLALEEIEQTYVELDELLEMRHVSIGRCATEEQSQAVKISGTITVSF
jgi:hypothetical protein